MRPNSLRCLWDNVLVEVDRGGKEEISAGGIHMPATRKPGHRRQGKIVAIGPGKRIFHEGAWITRPMSVSVGQEITFEIGSGTVFPEPDSGKEYVVIVEEQVTGIFKTAEEEKAEQRERDDEWERARSRREVIA